MYQQPVGKHKSVSPSSFSVNTAKHTEPLTIHTHVHRYPYTGLGILISPSTPDGSILPTELGQQNQDENCLEQGSALVPNAFAKSHYPRTLKIVGNSSCQHQQGRHNLNQSEQVSAKKRGLDQCSSNFFNGHTNHTGTLLTCKC